MKKLLIITICLLSFVGCGNAEQKTTKNQDDSVITYRMLELNKLIDSASKKVEALPIWQECITARDKYLKLGQKLNATPEAKELLKLQAEMKYLKKLVGDK